jgi:hypothetical protein
MEARPPALIEAVVGRLIPPAFREHVLGDLHERYTSPSSYLLDVARVVPLLIAGRLRTTFDGFVVLGELQIILLTFYTVMSRAYRTSPLRAAACVVPACAVLVMLCVRDAYAPESSGTKGDVDALFGSALVRAAGDIAFATACASVSAIIIGAIAPDLLPSTHAMADALTGSGLMLFAWRAAWRTQFSPGSRRMRVLPLSRVGNPRRELAGLAVSAIIAIAFALNHAWMAALSAAVNLTVLCGIFRRGSDRLKEEIG